MITKYKLLGLFATGILLMHFLFLFRIYGKLFPGFSDLFKIIFIFGYVLCIVINVFSFKKNSLLHKNRYQLLAINIILFIVFICFLVINANYFSNWKKNNHTLIHAHTNACPAT